MPPRSYLPARVPTHRPVTPRTHSLSTPHQLPRLSPHPIAPSPSIPIASSQFAFLRLSFSTLPPRAYPSLSPLFALAQLSNARESQAFAKKSRLSRIEHSPALEMIRSSEVEQLPFVTTSNSARETRERRLEKEKAWREFKGGREALARRRERGRAWNGQAVSEWGTDEVTCASGGGGAAAAVSAPRKGSEAGSGAPLPERIPVEADARSPTSRPVLQSRTNAHALAVGKAVLSAQAARQGRLTRALATGQRLHAREVAAWDAERRTYERERRSGSLIVLASALVATGALAWRWGETRSTPAAHSTSLEQWRKKWEMRESEAARAAAASEDGSGMPLAGNGGDMTAVQYTCHEDGCGQRKFATDADFMGHYRATHPVLVEHLYPAPEATSTSRPKSKSWFWA